MTASTEDILAAAQDVERRAERVEDNDVVETYVEVPALKAALFSRDNGIVFGRRGTGKTHALRYLAESARAQDDLVIYIDLDHDLGSTGDRYNDPNLSVPERATKIIVDVLSMIHDQLLDDAFNGKLSGQVELLDRMLDHFGEVFVAETVQAGSAESNTYGSEDRSRAAASLRGVEVDFGSASTSTRQAESSSNYSGRIRARVHVGAVSSLLKEVLQSHTANRCWLLFDEWSSVPLDLQPYLAELLRKLFFGIPKVTVRIAAITHRSDWRISGASGDYIGLEINSEIFTLIDLDEFTVFPARSREEQIERSQSFFKALLFRHLNRALRTAKKPDLNDPDELATLMFTQVTSLNELVRAAEGVPRDALTIAGRAAQRAGSSRISTKHVRSTAAQLYQSGKATQLNASHDARRLMDFILEEVLAGRKARAFLLPQQDANDAVVQQLIDDRILHVIKKAYSAKDAPGARYDVIAIDYGCYVGLLGTAGSPDSILGDGSPGDDVLLASFFDEIEVPEDDYRAIRRTILDMNVFRSGAHGS